MGNSYIAKTLKGLEEVLATELIALGADNVEIQRRAVAFTGDKMLLYKANLHLRTALRILMPIYTFKAKTPDEIYEASKSSIGIVHDPNRLCSGCYGFSKK